TIGEEGSESDLARTNKAELNHAYPEWDVQVVTDLADVSHTGGPSADPDKERVPVPIGPEIAHYLLLAVLVLVFVEVLMAWQFGHYSATPGNEPVPAAGPWLPALSAGLVLLAAVVIGGTLLHWR